MSRLTLKSLRLNGLHSSAFLGLGSLRYLDLSNNNISTLPDEIFQWLGSIHELKLSENRLSDESRLSFLLSTFAQLVSLELAVNQLQSVPDLSSSSNLVKVDLSYNRILNLPGSQGGDIMGPLTSLDRLETLLLNNNQIEWVDGNFFR